jgi:hypothetical protein
MTKTPQRLTEQQAMDAINAMTTTNEQAREALRRQWLSGNPGARFVVLGQWKRQQG